LTIEFTHTQRKPARKSSTSFSPPESFLERLHISKDTQHCNQQIYQKQPKDQLLSLVVIFTQSIQLSKINKRLVPLSRRKTA